MPAYFTVKFQFRRECLYPDFMKDFYNTLFEAGLKFKSGYWYGKNDDCETIINWNQQKIEDNFVLGRAQHVKYDYKQMLFDFGDFSEVRGFWINYRDKNEFDFFIIIPEDDIFEYFKPTHEDRYFADKIKLIVSTAAEIWEDTPAVAVQTEHEFTEADNFLDDLKKGNSPTVLPFAVLPNEYIHLDNEAYSVTELSEKGSLVVRKKLTYRENLQ